MANEAKTRKELIDPALLKAGWDVNQYKCILPQATNLLPTKTLKGEGILAGEIFYSLKDVQVLIKLWQHHYNTIKPHNSLDYMLPAPAAVLALASHICTSNYLKLWYNFKGRSSTVG